ncbi:Protein of unknown function [Gryllus bimaculatus]|nr:Protein of unknown function [Gryllus bimaculatus]
MAPAPATAPRTRRGPCRCPHSSPSPATLAHCSGGARGRGPWASAPTPPTRRCRSAR